MSWSPLGSGLNDTVNAMVTYDDGRGAKLVVTGQFTTAGGGSANRVAAWDGTAWSALGPGLGNVPGIATTVRGHSLAVHDVGNGLRLYVGGLFSSAGGSTSRAYSVAQWDGSAWSALDGGVRGYGESAPVQVSSVTSFGDALLVGGSFAMVGRDLLPCTGFAKWSVAPPFCRGDTNCDGAVTFEDIDPFVARLGCPGSGPACDTGCAWQAADVDGNGEVNFNDIDPFVARLGAVCR